MDAYYQEVRKLEGRFRGLELHHIPRRGNGDVGVLAKAAAERKPVPAGVFVNDLNSPSVREKPVTPDPIPKTRPISVPGEPTLDQSLGGPRVPSVALAEPDQVLGGRLCLSRAQANASQAGNADWRTDLLVYLLNETLPTEHNAAQRVARRAKTCIEINGELFKRSPSETGMLMKCISIAHGKEILLEIHSGICTMLPSRKGFPTRLLLAHGSA